MEACQHYDRGCYLQSPACQEFFPCRLCHDQLHYQQQKDIKKQHKLDRHQVRLVKCRQCSHIQPPYQRCQSCNFLFGEYFCGICNLYDNNTAKQIFHCEKCGICRVGGRENFFHCDSCNACLSVSQRDSHKCLENVLKNNCPVCMEDMFSSRESPIALRCGHYVHKGCYNHMIQNNCVTCPSCHKSIQDFSQQYQAIDKMIAETPMPEEYRDMKVNILCNECLARSEVNFHFYGMKCGECGGYNTSRSQ